MNEFGLSARLRLTFHAWFYTSSSMAKCTRFMSEQMITNAERRTTAIKPDQIAGKAANSQDIAGKRRVSLAPVLSPQTSSDEVVIVPKSRERHL